MMQHAAENYQMSEEPQGCQMAKMVKEVTPTQAWQLLQNKKALLVDVRTEQELSDDGQPDITAIGGESINIAWRLAPDFESNPRFMQQLQDVAGFDTTILFLCRSGQRSYDAAIVAGDTGFTDCANVIDGMEGVNGWKASGLSWGCK